MSVSVSDLSFHVQLTVEDVSSYAMHEIKRQRQKRTEGKKNGRLLRRIFLLLFGFLLLFLGEEYRWVAILAIVYGGITLLATAFGGKGTFVMDKRGEPRPYFVRFFQNRVRKGFKDGRTPWLFQPTEIRLTKDAVLAINIAGEKSISIQDLRGEETLEYFYFTGNRDMYFILPKRYVHDADVVSKWLNLQGV